MKKKKHLDVMRAPHFFLLCGLLALGAPNPATCAWYHKLNPKNLFKRATPEEKAAKERAQLLKAVNSRIHKTNDL